MKKTSKNLEEVGELLEKEAPKVERKKATVVSAKQKLRSRIRSIEEGLKQFRNGK